MLIYTVRWFKEEDGNISVDLFLFVLLFNIKTMNRLKFNYFEKM